jgi:carbonic anhydrase
MRYCTAVNCMDGRVQRPVLDYLTQRYGVPYVDTITEPGPNGILSRRNDKALVASVLRWIDVSVHKHHSVAIAVVGHHDCDENPGDMEHQNRNTRGAVRFLRTQYPDTPIVGLWVDEMWTVVEIEVGDE